VDRLLLLAGVPSVFMRVVVYLFGPERLRADAAYGASRLVG
jgi:hypothetical protein